MQQLREGADASLGVASDRIRERQIVEGAAGGADKVEPLVLTQPTGQPFAWVSSDPPPLYLTAARFRTGVYQLNTVIVEYAGLLAQLASPDLVKPETFDKLATDLNGNLRSAVTALGGSPPNKEIAIFSTAAAAGFKAYVQHKQKSALLKALQDNQSTIEEVAEMGAKAVQTTAAAFWNEYRNTSKGFTDALARSGTPPAARQVAYRGLVDLDDKFIKELSALRGLHESYKALPAAHRELAAGITDPALGFPAIQEIGQRGRDLLRLYEQLSKEDKKDEKKN
jgi:type II secretory pathway pseudopilin PulG